MTNLSSGDEMGRVGEGLSTVENYRPIPHLPTPEWLTTILRDTGHLMYGEVIAVEQRMSDAFNSRTSFLQVRYSDNAPTHLPTAFVLKQNGPEAWSKAAGRDEVKFYQLMATLPDHPAIIIQCYGAAYDETTEDSYVLLQDLSATHAIPVPRDQQLTLVDGVPPQAMIAAVVDTLAQLHAYWWNHPLLDRDVFVVGYWTRNADRFAQYLQRRRRSWATLMAQAGDDFPSALRTLYEQVFQQLPQYWETYLRPRFQAQHNLTLIHGDAYFANFLCPKEGASGQTYLLDWQSPSFNLGAHDLVNLCATFWTAEQRHAENREVQILRRYLAGLQKHGVTNYTWDDLCLDYRMGLIFWLLMPVQDGGDGAAKSYWWPKMQCLVAAFHDWQCEALLGITHPLG